MPMPMMWQRQPRRQAAQLKVDAAKVLMEAYADDVVSDEEESHC